MYANKKKKNKKKINETAKKKHTPEVRTASEAFNFKFGCSKSPIQKKPGFVHLRSVQCLCATGLQLPIFLPRSFERSGQTKWKRRILFCRPS